MEDCIDMYAGHFAAGLALRGRARNVPLVAFLSAVFLLDFLWVGFGVFHLDAIPWDDWSHSLVTSALWGILFAAMFWNRGRVAVIALWVAVFSHYILDLLVQGASLYPSAPQSLLIPILVSRHAHLFQLAITAPLLMIFLFDERRANLLSWRSWVVCLLIVLLNGRFLLRI
jgi:hypothetical protein